MKYKYRFNFEEYVSYLKMHSSLMKESNIINIRLLLCIVVIYICISILIRLLQFKTLSNLFIIIGGIAIIFSLIISSKKVLSKNPKIIAKIIAKKYPNIIYAEKSLEVKNNEVRFYYNSSFQVINGKAIKDVIVNENIIGIVSIKDRLCAYIPISVFKDENEKEEFIKIIKEMKTKDNLFEEKMDYSYRIDVTDYANYICAYNDATNLNNKANKFILVNIVIFGGGTALRNFKDGYYKLGIILIIVMVVMYICFCVLIRRRNLNNEAYIKASASYLKKNPHYLNEQQIKLEEDGVLYHMNNITRKINFADIKKVYLKNTTIIALGKINELIFMIPTDVFADEHERDNFIEALNN